MVMTMDLLIDQTKDVLLVEDDDAHATVLTRALEDRHPSWQIECVKTLKMARVVLADRRSDLMLLDNRLPDGEGVELLPGSPGRRRFPIVMMTAYDSEGMAVHTLKLGALDYVVRRGSMFADMPRIAERTLREWEHILQGRRVGASLRQSEHIVSASTDMMAILDRDYVYLAVNPAYLKVFNKTLD
jgi:DNA-binding NtrC family response regulator